jgi:hypothetical protein
MITPEPKPDPTDPIWNPPAVSEIVRPDLSLATLNEPHHPLDRTISSSA